MRSDFSLNTFNVTEIIFFKSQDCLSNFTFWGNMYHLLLIAVLCGNFNVFVVTPGL